MLEPLVGPLGGTLRDPQTTSSIKDIAHVKTLVYVQ